MNMKNLTLLTILSVLALAIVACGGEQPVTVGQENETRVARQTEIPVTQTHEAESRYNRLARIAPSGTTIEADLPGNQHDDFVVYEFEALPPNGGVHHNSWQKCGIYEQPILPQHAIHAMEHGAVWITYQTDTDTETISDIERLGRGQPYALISPYPNQESPLVLTAWGLQLAVDSVDDDRVDAFLDAFLNGIQSPEPRASCTSGVETVVEQDTTVEQDQE